MRKMENNNYKKSSIHDLRQTLNDPNHELNQPGRNNSYTHGVQIFHAKPNEPLPPKRFEFDNKHINPDEFAPQQPPIPNSPFKDLKDQLINRTYMHTPSPPSNFEDYDVDEKLGVKCTFEKPCTWTYDEADGSNFFVTSGANLTAANMTGQLFRGKYKKEWKFFNVQFFSKNIFVPKFFSCFKNLFSFLKFKPKFCSLDYFSNYCSAYFEFTAIKNLKQGMDITNKLVNEFLRIDLKQKSY
jgi:hypothetical protein